MPNEISEKYANLTQTSARSTVSAVLNSIIFASPLAFDSNTRGELIKQILEDLKSFGKSRLSGKDAAQAVLAIKTLGREPSGSEVIASPKNLSTLLSFQSTLKEYPDAANEALRCIANALLLIEQARFTFLEKDVDGGTACVLMLEKTTLPDQIFILSRILFLATASGSSHIETMVETKHNGRYLVDIIGSKLDSLVTPIQSGANLAREAMTDLLKLTFNILLYYPSITESEPQTDRPPGGTKVMGDFWSSKLDGLLAPILRVFLTLPPAAPCPIAAPLTHVIHALIAIPVSPSLKPIWFASYVPPSSRASTSNAPTPKSPASQTPQRVESSQSSSPAHSPSSTSPTSPKPSTLDRAISVLTAGRKTLSRSSSPVTTHSPSVADVLERALDFLDNALAHYFPGKVEVDDPSVRELVKKESQDSLDDLLSPLSVLISRLCAADEACRTYVRQFIVPADLDRSSPLEEREDILGRCLRLLGSVYHSRLKESIGEMLYATADSNATTLSALFGYGNVAGFLFNKGVLSAPAQDGSNAPTVTSKGEAINPITGTTVQPKATSPDMSDEEKEREMEKLMVLFDRLEKTGALPKEQNPIRKAIHEGKFANA